MEQNKDILQQYKVSTNNVKGVLEITMEQEREKLDLLLGKEINSKREAYDNIVELKAFLEKPHDYLPDAENKVNEKLYYIQTILGKDILDKGLKIYEYDKLYREAYSVMRLQDRIKLEQEILNNPKLPEQLADLRYNPEQLKNCNGTISKYLTVYSKMIERASDCDRPHETSELDKD